MLPPQSLANLLKQTLKQFKLDDKARDYSVITQWEQIVGPKIAAVAHAEKLERGTLTVRVASAAWRYEMTMRSAEVLRKIADACGHDLVREIRWRV